MVARRRMSYDASSFFSKDLFIFILIIAIVAIVTYLLTYNAITAKFDQQLGATRNPASYQLLQAQ